MSLAEEGRLLGELADLAAAGAAAVVGAMATDAWQATRSRVARLFGRRGPTRQIAIEAELDADAALVDEARNPDEVRASLAARWRAELEALLHQHPHLAEELRALVAQATQALPEAEQTWMQTNIAHDHATQNIVQHGTLNVHAGGAGMAGGAPTAQEQDRGEQWHPST